MRVSNVSCGINRSLNFGYALSSKQEKKFKEFQEEDKRTQGYAGGVNLVKYYIPSLPSNENEDTGIGKVNSKEAQRAYEIANVYYNANAIKVMPLGQLTDKPAYNGNMQCDRYAGAYNRSAFALGEDMINLFDLASDKWGNILPKKEADNFAHKHKSFMNSIKPLLKSLVGDFIDFDTTLNWKNQQDYPVNEPLKIAFENFKNPKYKGEKLDTLRREFEEFKHQKHPVDYDEIYTRLALFPYIKDGNAEVPLFKGFDSDPAIRAKNMPEYNKRKEQYKDEIEFYKFKQFIARKTLEEGKAIVNSQGMDFTGDCIIGFSWVEQQVFPDAFLDKSIGIGWGLPALNIFDLRDKDDSPAHKMLKAKVTHYLTQYDRIRFDVGWQYMNPKLVSESQHWEEHFDFGNKITDFIEQTAREVKGDDFDQKKLMYECDANYKDFPIQDESGKQKIKKMKGLAILSTAEEKNDDKNIGWGNAAFIRENLKLGNDNVILGTNNHDTPSVLSCAKDKEISKEHSGALMRVFRLRDEDGVRDGWKLVKDDNNMSEHIKKCTRARFAETSTFKNKFIQFYDLLGREEATDYHTGGKRTDPNHKIDYKNRLERNYEENFHRALQDGVGYNAADVIKFRMEHDGGKERNPELYEKAAKYAAYLQKKGEIYTRDQADNSKLADLDIEKMSLEEIQNLQV